MHSRSQCKSVHKDLHFNASDMPPFKLVPTYIYLHIAYVYSSHQWMIYSKRYRFLIADDATRNSLQI